MSIQSNLVLKTIFQNNWLLDRKKQLINVSEQVRASSWNTESHEYIQRPAFYSMTEEKRWSVADF